MCSNISDTDRAAHTNSHIFTPYPPSSTFREGREMQQEGCAREGRYRFYCSAFADSIWNRMTVKKVGLSVDTTKQYENDRVTQKESLANILNKLFLFRNH